MTIETRFRQNRPDVTLEVNGWLEFNRLLRGSNAEPSRDNET